MIGFPDIAHDTPAIAATVRHQHNNRQAIDTVRGDGEQSFQHGHCMVGSFCYIIIYLLKGNSVACHAINKTENGYLLFSILFAALRNTFCVLR